MELKNKDIAEGMYVVNGKQTWRVIFWDKKYQNALLQFIDEKGNRTRNYVIAEGYTLDGTEKEPHISWINGLYFDARTEDDAFIEFDNWLKGDSMKESLIEKDDTIFAKDIKRWMLSGKDINITFKNGDELVGAVYEHRKDSDDKNAECFLCEDLTADYTGQWFIVEIYDGKISEIKFQSYDWLEDYLYDNYELEERLKKAKFTESAKPINEKNVAKFVGELNEWIADNVHYKDLESSQFTIKYGKLYDFKYGWDYSYGDKGLLKVWDDEGTLDWFEESYVKDFIVNLAKKYGWYCEAVTDDSDFTFAEL